VKHSFGNKFALLGMAAMLASAPIAPLSAQLKPEPVPGSRLTSSLEQLHDREARRAMSKFADCAVKLHRDAVVGFVLDASKLDIDQASRKVFDDECLVEQAELNSADVMLKMPIDVARYALADALVRSDLPALDPNSLRLAAALQYPAIDPANYAPKAGRDYTPKELENLRNWMNTSTARVAFYRYGECVVRSDPASSRVLLMSPPTSGNEAAAFKALMPSFGACLSAGEQFKTNHTMMRGTIAVAYYRLARAPQAPVGATK